MITTITSRSGLLSTFILRLAHPCSPGPIPFPASGQSCQASTLLPSYQGVAVVFNGFSCHLPTWMWKFHSFQEWNWHCTVKPGKRDLLIFWCQWASYLDGEKVLIWGVHVISSFFTNSFKKDVQVQMKNKNSQSRGSITLFIVVFIRFYILFIKF